MPTVNQDLKAFIEDEYLKTSTEVKQIEEKLKVKPRMSAEEASKLSDRLNDLSKYAVALQIEFMNITGTCNHMHV